LFTYSRRPRASVPEQARNVFGQPVQLSFTFTDDLFGFVRIINVDGHGIPLADTSVLVEIRNGARVTLPIITVAIFPSVGRIVRTPFLNRAKMTLLDPVAVIGVNEIQIAWDFVCPQAWFPLP
jgi:hypothetical protein